MDQHGTALTGRRALVTGASRGIGEHTAVLFARQGADVAITARSQEKLDAVAEQVRAEGRTCVVIPADITDPAVPAQVVDAAVAGLGGLDILVNNAGGNNFMSSVKDMRFSGWQKIMTLNVDSIVLLTQAALPALMTSGNASIVNVSSAAAIAGTPYMSHYGAAKAAIISLTRSLAIELATSGVRVNALVPGWIETDLTDFLRVDEGVEHATIDRVPMKRWGTSDEIAQGALFLASDASSFMTGQSLVLDGGMTINP